MGGWVSQFRKGVVELCLLTLLAGEESYGYRIVQALRDVAGLEVSESTVYPILARLKADGCLGVRTGSSAGGPARRYFHLTRQGEKYLAELNDHWDAVAAGVKRLRGERAAKGES